MEHQRVELAKAGRTGRRLRLTALGVVGLLGSAEMRAQTPSWPSSPPPAAARAAEDGGDQGQKEGTEGFRDWVERQVREFDGDQGAATRGVFPLVGVMVPGAHIGAGAGYRDHRLFGSPLGFEVSGMVSVRAYQSYRGRFGFLGAQRHTTDLRPPDASLGSMVEDGPGLRPGAAVYLESRYRVYPRHRFYGMGPESRDEDRTDYLVKGAAHDLVVQAQLTPAVGISGRIGVLNSQIGEGRDDRWPATHARFQPQEAPGLVRTPRYLVAGLGAVLDTRDRPGDPSAGLFLAATAWRFETRGGGRFDFTRLAFDARTYFRPAWSPGVVALRLVASADLLAAGHQVPFFLQYSLGGRELLRSSESTRFRDRSLVHATVEYRLTPHPVIEIAPFVDAGTIGPALSLLSREQVKANIGIGVRPRWKGRVLGRMEWAVGRHGQRLLFAAGPVF